jgi:hypothetical protein
MIIVKLQGGLGNQMFQYAAGRALAIRKNTTLKFDLTYLLDRSPALNIIFRDYDLDVFPNIQVPVATNKECLSLTHTLSNKFLTQVVKKTIGIKSYFREKKFSYDSNFKMLPSNVYIDGFWQSEKYFHDKKETIRRDFAFAPLSLEKNYQLADKINTTNSVCLNVRRGDFVSDPVSSSVLGFKGPEYIHKAVQAIEQRVSNPHFYIFSDDIDWCKEHIRLEHPVTIVDHHQAGRKFADYLQLMSSCKHLIIPNSSFAWWAAWLNSNPDKIVVAPLLWFNDTTFDTKDLIPDSWIKI